MKQSRVCPLQYTLVYNKICNISAMRIAQTGEQRLLPVLKSPVFNSSFNQER